MNKTKYNAINVYIFIITNHAEKYRPNQVINTLMAFLPKIVEAEK